MWTEKLAPGARSLGPQVSVCGLEPPTAQLAPPLWLSTDQLMPSPPGSGSLRTTLRAMPVPAALLFVTVTVKPTFVPAETGVASGVFVMDRFGHWTVMLASAVTGSS